MGFDLVGTAPLAPPATIEHYQAWVQSGFHGEMAYLARPDAVAKREDLSRIQPGVRFVIAVGVNYFTGPIPPAWRQDPSRGIIARYAWGEDYHQWLESRLQALAAFIQASTGEPVPFRAYVDTGPILERDLAARAGLGFVGKNTNLIHPALGSWLFLGELLVDTDLSAPQSLTQQGTCGSCTRCLQACPTGALVAPYLLDARRCISYLTIELKGAIPRDLRPLIGNRIFGCDVCQEVCPWNRRFAQPTHEPAFQPGPDRVAPRLLDLLALDDYDFRRRYQGTPLARSRQRGLLRNVAVALGNWGDPASVEPLTRALDDHEPLIRGHAAWALGQITDPQSQAALARALPAETDPWVREEIELGMRAPMYDQPGV